jgi:chitinase
MTYDYHTGGRSTHFNAPLGTAQNDPTPALSIRNTVDTLVHAGVPRARIVVGVPFYGYGYGGVAAEQHGLFQSAQRNGNEDTTVAGPRPRFVGSIRYYDIANALRAGFQRYWEEHAQVPWLYNPDSQTWITYDDAESIRRKAEFVRQQHLGGIMIWELSGDDGSLLPVIARGLGRQ